MHFRPLIFIPMLCCLTRMTALETLKPSCRDKTCNVLCWAKDRKEHPIDFYHKMYNDFMGFPFQRPYQVPQVDDIVNRFHKFECGIRAPISEPITGWGEISPEKAWPWHSIIVGTDLLCAGALISEDWVVTVPRCAREMSEVYLGQQQRHVTPFTQVRKVVKIIFHEGYDMRNRLNSVALLKLDSSAIFTEYVKPICLPLEEIDPETEANCFITGFGFNSNAPSAFPDFLQHKLVHVMRQDWCTFTWNLVGFFFDKRNLCTEIEDSRVCDGEMGDPLTCQVAGKFYLIGLLCDRHMDCHKGFVPDIFIRISEYSYWILDAISRNS